MRVDAFPRPGASGGVLGGTGAKLVELRLAAERCRLAGLSGADAGAVGVRLPISAHPQAHPGHRAAQVRHRAGDRHVQPHLRRAVRRAVRVLLRRVRVGGDEPRFRARRADVHIEHNPHDKYTMVDADRGTLVVLEHDGTVRDRQRVIEQYGSVKALRRLLQSELDAKPTTVEQDEAHVAHSEREELARRFRLCKKRILRQALARLADDEMH
eukprot:ctg_1620.g303